MSPQRRQLPEDPQIRALVQAMSQRSMSRRGVLGAAGALGLGGLLAACGTGGKSGGSSASAVSVKDISDTDPTVNWANWTLYLDYDEKSKSYPTLDQFKEQTGISVNYVEDIDGNDTYYGKVQGQLKAGQDIGQDLITLTDWMAGRIIRQGYTQELDHANIPNLANLLPDLKDVDFDPGRKNSITWQTGYAGIAWNKKKFPKGLKNVSDLWDPALKGRVTVLDEMRDTMGLLMLDHGVDITGQWGENEFGTALEDLRKNIGNGQIRQVKGNS